jgi:hypothetical protein
VFSSEDTFYFNILDFYIEIINIRNDINFTFYLIGGVMINVEEKEIKVDILKVDKKRMTISFFNQIPVSTVYKADGSFKEDINLLGRVNHQLWWLVYTRHGILFKCNTEPMNSVLDIKSQEADIESLKGRLRNYWSKELEGEVIEAQMKLLEIINANKTIKKVKSLKQLYIAI